MTTLLNADGSKVTSQQMTLAKLGGRTALGGWGSNPVYRGGSSDSQELTQFRSPHISAKTAGRWNRQIIADRANDLARNESLVGTATRKRTGMAIGADWKLQAMPDAETLRITQGEADILSEQIEREFRTLTQDPRRNFCAARRHDWGGILRTLHQSWNTVNEVLAVLIYRSDPRSIYGTGIQIIDPDRLSNPHHKTDDEFLRDGVEIDEYGAATGYWIRQAHAADYIALNKANLWDYVERETPEGRPVCIHGFRQQRAEELRGMSFLAPLIEKFAMRAKMERTELQSAVLNATFAAFVQSGFDPDAVAEMLGLDQATGDSVSSYQDQRMNFYGNKPVVMDGITIPILMPGDKVEGNTLGRNPGSFNEFNKILMRNIAATLGVAEGQISGDYTGLNFSTLRGAYNEIWNDIMIDRAEFGTQVVHPIYFAFLDEAIALGRITPPSHCADLFDEPAAWCRANWIGPARGYIDPEKEAKGDILALEAGITSEIDVTTARGKDFESVIRDKARAKRIKEKHGVSTGPVREMALMPSPAGNSN